MILAAAAVTNAGKAIALALDGDAAALRLCLERLVPPRRDRTVRLPLRRIRKAADIESTMAAEMFAAKLGHLVERYRAGATIDLAAAPPAELLAWCLARSAEAQPSLSAGNGECR